VPSGPDVPSLAQAVFDHCKNTIQKDTVSPVKSMHQMVVHRLGADTSGLVVFAKTMEAVRGMNALFRTRKVTRQYEVLVAGHVAQDQGLINLPLMRCYEYPPYMRVSTTEHQRKLIDLDPAVVGKRLLEAPKASLTHYHVVKREGYGGSEDLPVTRMTLTSMTGRTHQLNVHCAAMGHPIVHDAVYGWRGSAAPHGGLEEGELPRDRATDGLQRAIDRAGGRQEKRMCVHAKLIRFRHPATGKEVEFTSPAPF
jgi:23S rRNA-/tRNA-specific pseudouridylate synthase